MLSLVDWVTTKCDELVLTAIFFDRWSRVTVLSID